jgi:Flp pilus assembly protein TadD
MKLRPTYAQEHFNLGLDCAQRGQMNEAAAHFRLATELQPDFLEAYINLGNSLMGQWRLSDAITEFKKALAIAPNNVEAENNLALILATASDSLLRNGAEAVRLAEHANQIEEGKNPRVLLTLASAYAETERFPDAVATAEHGLQIAEAQSNSELADTLQARLKLYRANQPFHGLERPH